MNELTVHFYAHNQPINPEFLTRLETVAEEYGVTIDSESRRAIEDAERQRKRSVEEFLRKANALAEEIGPIPSDSAIDKADWKHRLESFREQTGPIQSDSAIDIRELRDSR